MTRSGKNYKVISSKDSPRSEFHDELNLTGCEVSINHLKAGDSVPFVHSHKQNEEVYIVLEGSGVLYIDGEQTGEVEIGSFPYSRGPGGVTSLKANPYTSVNEEDYTSPFEYTGITDKINIYLPATDLNIDKAVKKAFLDD